MALMKLLVCLVALFTLTSAIKCWTGFKDGEGDAAKQKMNCDDTDYVKLGGTITKCSSFTLNSQLGYICGSCDQIKADAWISGFAGCSDCSGNYCNGGIAVTSSTLLLTLAFLLINYII